MPEPRGKRTRLTVDRELFEEFFVMDIFGRSIAVDALAMGLIRTPYEQIETLCLANHNMAVIFVDEIADELEKCGKADEYLDAIEIEDSARANRFIDEYMSEERHSEIFLGVYNEVRADLGLPAWDPNRPNRKRSSKLPPEEEEWEPPDTRSPLPDGAERAFVPIAPWRFERHFTLKGAGYFVARDAIRQSVIATPYEAVEMICNVNMMFSLRNRQNAFRLIFGEYTPEELMVAIENRTFSAFMDRTIEDRKFEEMTDDLMLEIRKVFGVPETEEKGKSERYKLWSETRRKPVN